MNEAKSRLSELWTTEDWWAVWLGAVIFILAPWIRMIPKVKTWETNPLESVPAGLLLPLLFLLVGIAVLLVPALRCMKAGGAKFSIAFPAVFILSVVSYIVASQSVLKAYGLGYAFWALILGLLISNTFGLPAWLRPGVRTELYIKIGLVLLGGEILFAKMLSLGTQGLLVAWVVTPIVIIFMYFFGTRFLKGLSKTLVIVIAAATSVCGVSAAIATAGACRAKKEELTLAVGMTLIFTVLMMVFMPIGIKWVGMDYMVGGAWMGGTIDSTGAVVAAGDMLNKDAMDVAAVVKMIQNVLIGVVAFVVAVLWVTRIDRDPGAPKPTPMEIWYRFPKFIIGFVAASVVFSFILTPILGDKSVDAMLKISTGFRGYFFCLAFVSIGLESNFKELAKEMVGGRPMVVYIVGQSFNLILTLIMAYIAFGGILFPR
ncbi:MAG: putative sulfate exporter family transporter [Acidobacteria bacterium]|nr:putative sulfate exporter family transporter [Acidobacteriota bacterium]